MVVVGHSYGGMVITGVSSRLPGRIRSLVYLDARLPTTVNQHEAPDSPALHQRESAACPYHWVIPCSAVWCVPRQLVRVVRSVWLGWGGMDRPN
jgi:pimeloyl-ACP methyl ester carboxylesterase